MHFYYVCCVLTGHSDSYMVGIWWVVSSTDMQKYLPFRIVPLNALVLRSLR